MYNAGGEFEYLSSCIIHLSPVGKGRVILFVRLGISFQHSSISLELNTSEPTIEVNELNDCAKNPGEFSIPPIELETTSSR